MSLFPSKAIDVEEGVSLKFYPKYSDENGSAEERQLLVGKPVMLPEKVDAAVAELVYALFMYQHHYSHQHPKTNPARPPVKRMKRHRNFYIWHLNQFRHWWKTSRLLVRLSGGIVFCQEEMNWEALALLDVHKRSGTLHAAKMVRRIGQGGPMRPFLSEVHPFTRTVRIILGVARAWEAKIDNRLYEVGVAEACAFMGNRCSRYWSRQIVDWLSLSVAFPISATLIAPYLEQNSRPVIVAMGFLRAVAPFAASFQGSRFGRQLTYNTYKYAFYRWRSVQSIMKFHELAGTYRDTNLDPHLLETARRIAEQIGHGKDPEDTRKRLAEIGFTVFGSGSGGYAVYRHVYEDRILLLHVTPYGPSILGELPMYIVLERRRAFYAEHLADKSEATLLDAATPREAVVRGFTYSGAYFQQQEWAILKQRHDRELSDYAQACRIMGTTDLPAWKRNSQSLKTAVPPADLQSLKAFVRRGRVNQKQRRDDKRWKQIMTEVHKMSKLVTKYQGLDKAPKRVILYLEGLDCAGKSSTGMLIIKALETCGYSVNIAQHNRPPTDEQKKKPWMDRIRFEYPDDLYKNGEVVPKYASIVWDRGPAGDFVYGKLGELPLDEKLQRYEEFRTYDANCRAEGVLFFKVFFVTDKDSIAKTLGKRLAHKQIARDLRAWLDANSVEHSREGLEEIENHIDPTDFVAFNKYEENLKKFTEVARNTDYTGHVGEQAATSIGYNNPWIVVNTSDRHKARLNIMKAFRKQLNCYATKPPDRIAAFDSLATFFERKIVPDTVTRPIPSNIVEEKERGLSLRAVAQSMVLILLFYMYARQTWNLDIENII